MMTIALLMSVLVSGPGASAEQPPSAAPVQATAPLGETLESRLAGLNPASPEGYFELGEEVAQDRHDPARLALARTLFVLAFSLDRATPGQRVAASSCLALADLATSERDRRWLISIADTIDGRRYRPDWVRRAEESASSHTAYLAATALGLVRSGDGIAARQVLEEPGVRPLLVKYERMLAPDSESGFTRFLEREAAKWPCPECHNDRIVKKTGTGRDVQYRLCTNCRGSPGPQFPLSGLITQLRFESALLSGIQRSWSAQVAADAGAPLRDPDPDELSKVFGVNVARTVWQDGAWVAPGAAPPTVPKHEP